VVVVVEALFVHFHYGKIIELKHGNKLNPDMLWYKVKFDDHRGKPTNHYFTNVFPVAQRKQAFQRAFRYCMHGAKTLVDQANVFATYMGVEL
jgi:hypothetical protein